MFIEDAGDPDRNSIGDVKIRYCGECDSSIVVTSADSSTSPSESPIQNSLLSESPTLSPSGGSSSSPSGHPSTLPSNGPTAAPVPDGPGPTPPTNGVIEFPPFPNSCDASECTYEFSINENGDQEVLGETTFPLDAVSFVVDFKVEIACTWCQSLLIYLKSPTGNEYIAMEDTSTTEVEDGAEADNYDMGQVAGSSSLTNVAPYIFVESGNGFRSPFTPSGVYGPEEWNETGPYAAGDWRFFAEDQSNGDPSSIGKVTIRYCGECPKGSTSSLLEGKTAGGGDIFNHNHNV